MLKSVRAFLHAVPRYSAFNWKADLPRDRMLQLRAWTSIHYAILHEGLEFEQQITSRKGEVEVTLKASGAFGERTQHLLEAVLTLLPRGYKCSLDQTSAKLKEQTNPDHPCYLARVIRQMKVFRVPAFDLGTPHSDLSKIAPLGGMRFGKSDFAQCVFPFIDSLPSERRHPDYELFASLQRLPPATISVTIRRLPKNLQSVLRMASGSWLESIGTPDDVTQLSM